MTEEEKKEFEEFLQWKAEKAKQAEQTEQDKQVEQPEKNKQTESPVEGETNVPQQHDSNQNTTKTSSDVPKESNSGLLIMSAAIVGILLLFLVVFLVGNKQSTKNPGENQSLIEDDECEIVDTAAVADADDGGSTNNMVTWDFSIEKDEMTDTKNIWAKIVSDNHISQSFPYEGYTYATITIRYMKKYGYDAIISISKGQIHGSRYNGDNYITARFDEGTPKKYTFTEAADGSSEMVFLVGKSDFIKRCKQAKDIKIEVPLYQAGRPIFTFHVDEPLVWREE